jgi:hypothetical protein
VSAIQTLTADEELRQRLVERGLELARTRTVEAQAGLVADFIAGETGGAPNTPD